MARKSTSRDDFTGELPGSTISISRLVSAYPALAKRLVKFHFPHVAAAVGGLLARPENHSATLRLEGLLHLAAVCCRGTRAPTPSQVRGWLNDDLPSGFLVSFEDPPEDVFVSNTATRAGNARLFEGTSIDNDRHVETCVQALTQIDADWAHRCYVEVEGLLRLSDHIAERNGLPRYCASVPRASRDIAVSSSILSTAEASIGFTDDELKALGIAPRCLQPFYIRGVDVDAIATEALGHTTLERRPLVYRDNRTLVAVPTAVGAAARRYILEEASKAGQLGAFQDLLENLQFSEVFCIGAKGWGLIDCEIDRLGPSGVIEAVGHFDEGGVVHLVYVPDKLADSAENLQGYRALGPEIELRIAERARVLANEPGYRRGLSVLVLGGIGRGALICHHPLPASWHSLELNAPDFVRLGWDADFSAVRAWKLLDQAATLAANGHEIVAVDGFAQLYAFARERNFALVPDQNDHDVTCLSCSWQESLRTAVRQHSDRHLVASPKGGFVDVQREKTRSFFLEDNEKPIFIRLDQLDGKRVAACIETNEGVWWIECGEPLKTSQALNTATHIWRMGLHWLGGVAEWHERRSGGPAPTTISFKLRFPDLDGFVPVPGKTGDPVTEPEVKLVDGCVEIVCTREYLACFARPDNVGDAMMAGALIKGTALAAGKPPPPPSELTAAIDEVVGVQGARYFHSVPVRSLSDAVLAQAVLPPPRFEMPEDAAWSTLGLARQAGWHEPAGRMPPEHIPPFLNAAVDAIRVRLEGKLGALNRASVIERAILNHAAIEADRRKWVVSSAALLGLHSEASDVFDVSTQREGERGLAALASRVIVEMAICMAPDKGGETCTDVDLDTLIADVAALLDCANASDAIKHDLVAPDLVVHRNGSFDYDRGYIETIQGPYVAAHGERVMRSAAKAYAAAFDGDAARDDDDALAELNTAFIAEFGIGLRGLASFAGTCAADAIDLGVAHFREARSLVEARLRTAGAIDPSFTFSRLALGPRARWDDPDPANAKKRDWYPWRFARRLSVVRRPLIQLSQEADPDVLIAPPLIDRSFGYLCGAVSGRLPINLFESKEMRSYIGAVVDRVGHEFNEQVTEALRGLGWHARCEVMLTELGGPKALGDIDVLAWDPLRDIVYALECKRLHFARTTGEIGERLTEYASLATDGKRTPIQKHLDRMAFLRTHLSNLSRIVGIDAAKIELRSGVVTDYIVPMQFSQKALGMVDVVADFSTLEQAIGRCTPA